MGCRSAAPYSLDRYHYDHARDRLAPWSSLARDEDGLDRRGPWWLRQAIRIYTARAFEASGDGATLEKTRTAQLPLARRVTPALASLELSADVVAAGYHEARALAFLAGAWLAEHAGETSLFDYYRQLPASASWQGAFEAAFGMSVADFLTAFEAYRAETAVPASGSSG